MRKAFISALIEQAQTNDKIFLLTGDLGFNIVEPFAEKFPNRFLNVGVAEANLVTVAAGLASTGFIPFVYSIATFMTMRPFEQIRNDICLQNLNVKIIGIGGGLAYTKAGPTHHSIEDIGLMRLLPNMTTIIPKDKQETYDATTAVINYPGPTYIRLEKNPLEIQHTRERFQIGKAQTIQKGRKLAFLTTGIHLATAIQTAELLKTQNIEAGIYSFPTVQPLDYLLLDDLVQQYDYLATIEEHQKYGGFSSIVADYLTKYSKHPHLLRFGLHNKFQPSSLEYQELMKHNDLLPQQIANYILKSLTI